MNPVDAALAKKRKVTLSVDRTECKYCGKLYHTGKKLTEHINQEHAGEQTIYACLYCTQPFNQYSEYLQHLGEHKDRVIRCRICSKEFKTITKLRKHTKVHLNQRPLCSVNFLTPQALQEHMKESHGPDPETVERQCSLFEFTCNSMTELAEHNQSVHRPYSCNICFLCFSAEYQLVDHRWAKHKISSLGTSVEAGDQGDQSLEPPQPENIGATQQDPAEREKHDQGNQLPEPPTPLEEPRPEEPKVLAGSQDLQVEVDEVKGLEVRTEEHNRECEACHHFFSSNMYRRSHVTRYHKALLRRCKMCEIIHPPWDFDRHLDSQHRKCKACQRYLINDEMLEDHMELKHPMVTTEPVETKEQVTRDSATWDTSCQDRQVKCQYCDRYFRNVAECNMHVNRRHKRVKCPECEKRSVKQADCENHFRDVHKFLCSIAGCSVFKYNEIAFHEHLRYNYRSKMVFRCNKCVKVLSTRSELHQHHEVDHGRVKLVDVQGENYPCLRCKREFLTKSMFVSHSRNHKEMFMLVMNAYGTLILLQA